MARVNIDDELHADKRFKRLVKLIGEELAVGKLYRFWHLAQHYWGKECQLMSLEEFQEEEWEILLKVKLAEIRGDSVYAVGSEEQFAWYLQKCRASQDGVKARTAKKIQPARSPGQPEQVSGQPAENLGQPSSPLLSAPAPLPLHSATVPLSSEQITKCWEAWSEVLKWAGKERNRSPRDDDQIGKAIQRWGFDDVLLAIQGARNEPGNEKFNPKQHVALYRIFEKVKGEPCKFEKFLGWGAELRMKAAAEKETHQRQEIPRERESTDPARVREILSKTFRPKASFA